MCLSVLTHPKLRGVQTLNRARLHHLLEVSATKGVCDVMIMSKSKITFSKFAL